MTKKYTLEPLYRNLILISIGILSCLMHFNIFSKELVGAHIWRQTQTQSTIINFYEEDMNIFNPRRNDRGDTGGILRIEFPLMQWIVACVYKVFGNHLWITRICMFIIGLLSVLGIYILFMAVFKNELIAVTGAWAFNFSPSFYYYTVCPMPDNMALCCSIWGMAMFFKWYQNQKIYLLFLSGLFLSAGALCKLPFILFFALPFMHFMQLAVKKGISRKTALNTLTMLFFVSLPLVWYISVIPHWKGNTVIKGMLGNDLPFSAILKFMQFIFFSTLPELLLNYGSVLFFLAGFYFLFRNKAYRNEKFSLILVVSILVLAYYLFEANTIRTGHDYYLFPFLPLLFMLVAYGAYNLCLLHTVTKYLTFTLLMLLPLLAYLRIQGRWDYRNVQGFKKDLLVYKDELRNIVPKESLVVAGNDDSHFIFLYFIDKKGWGFDWDYLPASSLKLMIEKGAQYLYSTSRIIESNEDIKHYLDSLLIEKGSIKVFRLKKHCLNDQSLQKP